VLRGRKALFEGRKNLDAAKIGVHCSLWYPSTRRVCLCPRSNNRVRNRGFAHHSPLDRRW